MTKYINASEVIMCCSSFSIFQHYEHFWYYDVEMIKLNFPLQWFWQERTQKGTRTSHLMHRHTCTRSRWLIIQFHGIFRSSFCFFLHSRQIWLNHSFLQKLQWKKIFSLEYENEKISCIYEQCCWTPFLPHNLQRSVCMAKF